VIADKVVNLRDISKLQRQLTCLDFGIVDNDHMLIERVHTEVGKRHKEHEKSHSILVELYERHALISNNRYALSKMHEKEIDDIKVIHELTPVVNYQGKLLQLLISDITVPMHDGVARFSQPPLCFTVSEDFKTWTEIELIDEQQCGDSNLAHVVQHARQMQRSRTPTKPKPL
jgi:hypothetical protein